MTGSEGRRNTVKVLVNRVVLVAADFVWKIGCSGTETALAVKPHGAAPIRRKRGFIFQIIEFKWFEVH